MSKHHGPQCGHHSHEGKRKGCGGGHGHRRHHEPQMTVNVILPPMPFPSFPPCPPEHFGWGHPHHHAGACGCGCDSHADSLSEAFEMLASASETFVAMCSLVSDETGVPAKGTVLPPYMRDEDVPEELSGALLGGDADWVISVGDEGEGMFVTGAYEELVDMWLEGPDAQHDWIAGIVGMHVDMQEYRSSKAADKENMSKTMSKVKNDNKDYGSLVADTKEKIIDDEANEVAPVAIKEGKFWEANKKEGKGTTAKADIPDGVPVDGNGKPVPVSVDRAIPYGEAELKVKAALEATGHVISPAPVYDWMKEAKFVAWHDDQPLLVSFGIVNDGVSMSQRVSGIKEDLAEWLRVSDKAPRNAGTVVFYVDGDHVTKVGDVG